MSFEVPKFLKKLSVYDQVLKCLLEPFCNTLASVWLLFLAHEYSQIKLASIVFQENKEKKEKKKTWIHTNPGFKQIK